MHVDESIYEEAARSGLHTPEQLAWMRQAGIRPSTQRRVRRKPVKQRPAWLAFLFRVLHLPERE